MLESLIFSAITSMQIVPFRNDFLLAVISLNNVN